jgi:hypothetical protein
VATNNGRGGPRPGAGRKPKPLRDHRRNRMTINLTDDELRALRSAAGKGSASDYARDVLLQHLARRRK